MPTLPRPPGEPQRRLAALARHLLAYSPPPSPAAATATPSAAAETTWAATHRQPLLRPFVFDNESWERDGYIVLPNGAPTRISAQHLILGLSP